ncbi:hypothetical protein Poly51_30580 [Rubripirellula tenax]|uniref:DUF2071 domain-containing protein n=1 Tax=Rubripirellula tenax TaxID=2528015 RepID=A0A5C6F4F5_9BACT|nr:DUF2071 domain-containing protein [Rubripirellula tenax]TWU54341.1 hypothetical protein Poly51_30580 [Rubripirellula tenax]
MTRNVDRKDSDRTWPLPNHPWVMRMTWSDLLFAHWRVAAAKVAALLPTGVTLDTWEGQAWIGVVPFLMSNVAPRLCPPIPSVSRFLELNVRTYVTVGGKPGVWFFSLDAASLAAVRVARATFNLPYMDATMSIAQSEMGETSFKSHRTHRGERSADYDASYAAAGGFVHAEPGSLEYWLTARYCLYSANRKGRIFRGEIDHPPWSLASAVYAERINTMGEPFGLTFQNPPHVLIAKPVDVHAWIVTECNNE